MPQLMSRLSPVLVALLMLGLAPSAMAQWKWRDASGKVQYSDLPPPPGTAEKDILLRPPAPRRDIVVRQTGLAASAPAPAASAPSQPSRAELEQQARQKQQEAEAAKRRKEEELKQAEARAENCRRATAQLRLLEEGVRLTRPNEAGENVVLDERQRAEELRRTRAVMAADCR